MVFLPGGHALGVNITVANVTSLTMCGESSSGSIATVVCSGSVGFSFTSMVDLKTYSLAFTSCSRLLKYAIIVPDFPLAPVYAGLLLQSTKDTELGNCFFHDNIGTALVVNNTNITLSGNTEFKHNRACGNILLGGGIIAVNSNLTFIGNTTFLDNSATFGQCPFDGSAVGGSAIVTLNNTILSFCGTSNFINNLAYVYGGAIYASENSILNLSGTNNFINNSAGIDGGAIYTEYNTVLSFNGASNFINNSAAFGSAIATNNTVLSFNGTTYFINNSALVGGAIFTRINNTLTINGTICFTNNGHYGEGVNLMNGYNFGGGVFMGLKSTFSILPNTTVYWENNHATLGGAIYVADVSPASYCTSLGPYVPRQECFFQLPGQNLSSGIDVQLVFKNNTADAAGSVLYGGAIDNCKLTGLDSHSSGEVFDMLVHIDDDNTNSSISSDPLNVCPCEHNHPDCSMSSYKVQRTVYPGETFQVSVVAVGQRDGTVPSRVISIIDQEGYYPGHLPDSQHLQQANNTCTKLNYTVLSLSQRVDIELHAEGSPCSVLLDTNTLDIYVDLDQICPPGFSISESEKACVCEPRLAQYTNNCT